MQKNRTYTAHKFSAWPRVGVGVIIGCRVWGKGLKAKGGGC